MVMPTQESTRKSSAGQYPDTLLLLALLTRTEFRTHGIGHTQGGRRHSGCLSSWCACVLCMFMTALIDVRTR